MSDAATISCMRGVELFAGGGGLLLGSSLAGVKHVLAGEWDRWACSTLRYNASNHYPLVDGLNIHEGDVRQIDYASLSDVDIVAGGPPCQPFSMGGKARAADDPRDMFPAMTQAISELAPRAFGQPRVLRVGKITAVFSAAMNTGINATRGWLIYAG